MPGNVYGKLLAFVVLSLKRFKTQMNKKGDKRKVFNAFSCLLSVYLTMITGARISEAVAIALDKEITIANRAYEMDEWHEYIYANYQITTPVDFTTKTAKTRAVYFFPVPKSQESFVKSMLLVKQDYFKETDQTNLPKQSTQKERARQFIE